MKLTRTVMFLLSNRQPLHCPVTFFGIANIVSNKVAPLVGGSGIKLINRKRKNADESENDESGIWFH